MKTCEIVRDLLPLYIDGVCLEGSRELVTDNGIIASLDGFSEALLRVCVDEEERIRMGHNSLRRVEAHFRWESIGERYLSVLGDSVEKSSGE